MIPCGLIAKSYFTDSYSLIDNLSNKTVFINESGIAYPEDKQYLFKNREDYLKTQWVDMENGM